jgi:hypothetical protein
MLTKTIATAALAGGLAFGIGVPAQAAQAQSVCVTDHVLVSAAVDAKAAVYGDAPLLSPASEAWIERVLVSPAVDEVSHIVRHDAQYVTRRVVDQPYVHAIAAVDAVSHVVHHDAITETVHHDAVTKPVHHEAVTKTVHHDAVTKVVHHDAVTKVVHHDAVTKTVHHDAQTHTEYTRYSWVGGGRGPSQGDTPTTKPSHWNADKKKYDGSETGVVLHQGQGNGSYFYWDEHEVVDAKAWDETVVVTPAWDEKVVVTPAWDEKVVVTPAWDEKVVVTPAWDENVVVTAAWDEAIVVTPAWDETVIDVEGEPAVAEQPEVAHDEQDLVTEAWDEKVIDVEAAEAVFLDIEHPAQAAVYGEPALVSAAVDAQPAVYEDVEDCGVVSADGPAPASGAQAEAGEADAMPAALALTGGGVNPLLPIGAGALIVGGLIAVLRRRRRTQD